MAVTGEGRLLAGDAARLRKGLFEGRFKLAVRPGDDGWSRRKSIVVEVELLALLLTLLAFLAGERRDGCLGERFSRAMSFLSVKDVM